MTGWTVLCDFDGTVALDDVTDSLLARFAAPAWHVLERDWRTGMIGSAECMAGQVALLDASRGDIDRHLATLGIDPAFAPFVDATLVAGCTLRVVSDGLDYAIHAVLARNGLEHLPVLANRLVQAGPRHWRLEAPFAERHCRIDSGHCKCASAVRARDHRHRVLFVGDGRSDFCVASEADYVFAKHPLVEHCRRTGIAHTSIVGFADAIRLLPALLAGELDASRRGARVGEPVLT